MNDLETGVYRSHAEYQEQRYSKHYFKGVVDAYIDVRNTPSLAAISHDPAVINPKLGADLIHYIVDVENATRKSLDNNPALIEQWEQLVCGNTVPNAASIIRKCARIYRARKLLPGEYFKVIKQGRRDRRSMGGAA